MSEKKIQEMWPKIMASIQEKINPHSYDTWFASLRPVSLTKEVFTLETPNQFFKDWLKEHYGALLEESLKEIGLGNVKINLTLSSTGEKPAPQAVAAKIKPESEEKAKLNSRYTFDSFVIGPSNRFAHAAALAVAESPAKAYNPLFIYGDVGLGKTHLLQAIGHHVLSCRSNTKVTYISSEEFTNQLINSIQNRTTPKFREKYRNVDVLIIDDIYFIAGKESTQEEFFHTFNTLYDAHKQIILSSDRSPRDIQGLEDRLVSRFGWGLVTDIQAPDFETRTAILRKKAELAGVEIPQEVTMLLSEKIKTNIRELEGALVRVIAHSTLEGEKISLDTVKKVLKDMFKEEENKITIENIQKKIADHFNIRFLDMRTKKRNQTVVFPRQLAMYLSRELTGHSLSEIGMYFGGKDHTTILHACNKITKDMEKQKDLKDLVTKLIHKVKE
ncbi:MAG: chromosomal replication initiator protein DnaA [Candidatus Omnitrophica bacterium]|nr:chromosomal replication initiator protein DnaA [Candidatus Omnitrophota bacterium]